VIYEGTLRGLPARDDRLQYRGDPGARTLRAEVQDRVLVLDERHEVHIVLALDDEDALAGVAVGVRVLEDVEQVAALDVDELLEPDAALLPELRVLRHPRRSTSLAGVISRRVPKRHNIGVESIVPRSVPERGPTTILRLFRK
jgi:hypothetical protein